MTERRDPDQARGRAAPRQAGGDEPASDARVLDLQRQAGNKAVADLLSRSPARPDTASPGIRLRDSLRAGRAPVQREFGLVVQRLDKEAFKMPSRLLKRGTEGSDVVTVQQLLGINPDGIFGRQTRATVIAFQRGAGLVPDGIVGPLTWSALIAEREAKGGAPTFAAKVAPGSVDKEFVDATAKLGPESTAKMASASTDKLESDVTAKLAPDSTAKMASASTDKLESDLTAKMASGSTDKLASDSTAKLDEFKA